MIDKQQFYQDQYSSGETGGPWWYQQLAPFVKTREDIAFEIISDLKGGKNKFLDLGCGEGDLVARLKPQFNTLVGCDIAENRLKIARKRNNPSKAISYKHCDLDQKLPFRANSFDVVTCLGAIEYTFDPYHVVAEIERILKPGGVVIIEVPNLGFLPERLKLLFGKLPSWPEASGWQGGRLHNFTHSSMGRLTENTRLSLEYVTGAGFLQPIRAFWPSLLCGDCVAVYRHD